MSLAEFGDKKYLPFAAKPRLTNRSSYDAEVDLVRSMYGSMGKQSLHEITRKDAEEAKMTWLGEGRTVKRRLNALRRVMDYAVSLGYIRENRIPIPRGLPSANRSDIWLNLEQIDRLLKHCDITIRPFIEFLILTGAPRG